MHGWSLSILLHLTLFLAAGLAYTTWTIPVGGDGSDISCTLREPGPTLTTIEQIGDPRHPPREVPPVREDEPTSEAGIPWTTPLMPGEETRCRYGLRGIRWCSCYVEVPDPAIYVLVVDVEGESWRICSREWRRIREQYGDGVIVVVKWHRPKETVDRRQELLRNRHLAGIRWPEPQLSGSR